MGILKTKLEFTDLNEGLNGEYDPTDSSDVKLLRVDCSLTDLLNENTMDASTCTMIPADTPKEQQARILKIMDALLQDAYHMSMHENIESAVAAFSYADETWADNGFTTRIDWDTDDDGDAAEALPQVILIPASVLDDGDESVSNYISEQTGWCHRGYVLEGKEVGA